MLCGWEGNSRLGRKYWKSIARIRDYLYLLPETLTSAVTIIVVTIFIATFQNYRIVLLSRYFLCVRNDIFARHLLCKHDRFTTSLLKFQHDAVTLQSRDANDVTRDCRPATMAEQRPRP